MFKVHTEEYPPQPYIPIKMHILVMIGCVVKVSARDMGQKYNSKDPELYGAVLPWNTTAFEFPCQGYVAVQNLS